MEKLIFAIFFLLTTIGTCGAEPVPTNITVIGEAERVLVADLATVSVSTSAKGTTAIEAKKLVDERANKFLKALNGAGFPTQEVSSQQINVQINWTYDEKGNEQTDGYLASRNIDVTLSNPQDLEAFLNLALSSGMDEFSSLSLTHSEQDQIYSELEDLAIANARASAEQIAAAAGLKVVGINEITPMNSYPYPYMVHGSRLIRAGHTSQVLERKTISPLAELQASIRLSNSVSAVFRAEPAVAAPVQ